MDWKCKIGMHDWVVVKVYYYVFGSLYLRNRVCIKCSKQDMQIEDYELELARVEAKEALRLATARRILDE